MRSLIRVPLKSPTERVPLGEANSLTPPQPAVALRPAVSEQLSVARPIGLEQHPDIVDNYCLY